MIKEIPDHVISLMRDECCVVIDCAGYDPEEVKQYLRERTYIEGNEAIKSFFLEEDYECECIDERIYYYTLESDEILGMLGENKLEDATLSFDIEDILNVSYYTTSDPKGLYVTYNNGLFFQNDYQSLCDGIKPSLKSLKKKFPNIKYDGYDLYSFSDPSSGNFVFHRYGSRGFQSKEIENDLRCAIDSCFSSLDNYDEYELYYFKKELNEIFTFLIQNDFYEAIQKLISFMKKKNFFSDVLSNSKFENIVNVLLAKKMLSFDSAMSVIGYEKLSTPVNAELLEYVHKNFPDRDIMSDYSIE